MYGDEIIGIGSRGYGGLEVPWSAISKWENQKNWWHNSVHIQSVMIYVLFWMRKPGNQEYQCTRAGGDGYLSWRRKNLPFLCLFVLFRPSMDCMMPTCIGEGKFLYSVYWFKCKIFPEIPSQTQPITWTSLSLVKLTHKISYHNTL